MAAWMSAGHSERTTHSKRATRRTKIATVMSATHNAPSHCENCETTGEEGGISTKIFVGYESDVVMRFYDVRTTQSRAEAACALYQRRAMPQLALALLVFSVCSATAQVEQWSSVVKIEATCVAPNYLRPWERSGQVRTGGSGFVVDGQRILTNYHVVEDAVDIRLSKTGHFKRWRARVVATGPDVDLATLEVVEDADGFFSDLVPVTWSDELAPLRSRVTVRGYPLGGTGLSVTEGVVSRIETKNYRLGPTSSMLPGTLLVIQIDAAINGGNSGGPAFDASDRVVGIAFQGIDNAQNIGYLIPASLARTYLAATGKGLAQFRTLVRTPTQVGMCALIDPRLVSRRTRRCSLSCTAPRECGASPLSQGS